MNKSGGGAQTTINGLAFERKIKLADILVANGFEICKKTREVTKDGKLIGKNVGNRCLYTKFLNLLGINEYDYISKRLLPDECFINEKTKTAYIVEKKFQKNPGSVDEKLQTVDFKMKQYRKLFNAAGYKLQFIYVCNEWFQKPEYKDTRNYIRDSGAQLYFNEMPLTCFELDT